MNISKKKEVDKMKCAMELLEIMETNKVRIERERIERERERIEKERIEEEQRIEKERIEEEQKIKNTLEFCEEIGKRIENLARQGKSLTICFECNSSDTLLTPTTKDYADGRASYHFSKKISLTLLREYFETYCFNVVIIAYFEYWHYGWGKLSDGRRIKITPKPKC